MSRLTFLFHKSMLNAVMILMLASTVSACSALQEWYDSMLSTQEEES